MSRSPSPTRSAAANKAPQIGFPDDDVTFDGLHPKDSGSSGWFVAAQRSHTLVLPPTEQEALDAGRSTSTTSVADTLLPSATKIRREIRAQVNDVAWARDVQAAYKELKRNQRRVIRSKLLAGSALGLEVTERCAKCTLPLGTCEHYKVPHVVMTRLHFLPLLKNIFVSLLSHRIGCIVRPMPCSALP